MENFEKASENAVIRLFNSTEDFHIWLLELIFTSKDLDVVDFLKIVFI